MKRTSRRNTIIVLVIIAILALIVANRFWQQARRPVSKSIAELQGQKGVPVSVDTVGVGGISESIELTGTVQGIIQSDLISKITERVVKVGVSVGQRVSQGQVLVVFDTSNPMAQYRQAKAALEDAEKDFARMQALLEQGAISEQMFEKTQTGLEVARANFEAARSIVEVISPIDGVVTSVNVSEGETVGTGSVVCTVARYDKVKVVVQASEADLQELSAGAAAFVRTAEGGEVPGKVTMISSSADPATRTFRVEVTADNASRVLKPGSFATVTVQAAHKKDALVVPSESVVTREGKLSVFVVNANSVAELRRVTLGLTNSRVVEVADGLKPGERVVMKGYELLRGGETVNIVEAE
jgi:membrane fusion protein (multidrug efflux system)